VLTHTRLTRKRFGLAIRRRRERLGWSQEEFAEYARIHRTYVSSIELGKVSVGIEVANELAKALDMRLSALIRMAE
jgi:transcriptional regulator with XRE-family HTH domain